ncbi:MAG: sulfotransferase [Pseudomonadota bacterium]
MTDPVIIYGALRSGTTLLRLMMNAHPALHCPGESDFLVDFLEEKSGGSWGFDHEELSFDRIFGIGNLEVPWEAEGLDATRALARQLAAKSPGMLVLILHRHLDRALAAFPQARIIHLLRDPRDIAQSSVGMGFAGNVYMGVSHWIKTETNWDSVVCGLEANQHMEVRYEDLITAPTEHLTRVCNFLRIDFDPAMLSYNKDSTYSQPDPSLIEQWRRKQTNRNVSLIEGRLGPLLGRRGYQPSGLPLERPGYLGNLTLRIDNKIKNLKLASQRYGTYDALAVRIARWLGLRGWHRRVKTRIDQKVVKFLK